MIKLRYKKLDEERRELSDEFWGEAPSDFRVVGGPESLVGYDYSKTFRDVKRGITVIASVEHHEEQVWLHVSVSKRGTLPSWGDLSRVKRAFLGDRYAVQALPPKADHISFYEVLHLFSRYDGPTLTLQGDLTEI